MNASGLQRQVKIGAYNFFWIAGFSIANSIYFLLKTRATFVIGLGITQFLDTWFYNISQSFPNSVRLIRGIGLLPDLFICGVFVLCGFLAIKGQRLVFIAGMGIYGLDAILTLVTGDIIGFGFHLFFLFYLFCGLQALNKLLKILPQSNPAVLPPKDLSR